MLIDVRQAPGNLPLGSCEGIIAGHHPDWILASVSGQPSSNQIGIGDVLRLHAKNLGAERQQSPNLDREWPGIGAGQTQPR